MHKRAAAVAFFRKIPLWVGPAQMKQRVAIGTMLLRAGCMKSLTDSMSDFDAVFSRATDSFLEFSFSNFS
jgi:hypothetical protein